MEKEISKDKAISLTKEKCAPENPDYAYRYDMINKVNNEWRIPIMNVNCICYATVNTINEITNCMKCNCTDLSPPLETEKVTITTDKTEYEAGEDMKITIENRKDSSVYIEMEEFSRSSHIYKMEIQKYENNSWKTTYYPFSERIKCAPGGQGPAIGCIEIKQGAKLERLKTLNYLKCVGNLNITTEEFPQMQAKELPSGKYRLKINIADKCTAGTPDKKPTFTYSNEFTIKEKEADTSKIGTYLAYLMDTRELQEQFSIDIEFSHELQDEESKEIENIFNLTFNRLPDGNIAHTSQFYGATADGHTINKLTKTSKIIRMVSTETPVTSANST